MTTTNAMQLLLSVSLVDKDTHTCNPSIAQRSTRQADEFVYGDVGTKLRRNVNDGSKFRFINLNRTPENDYAQENLRHRVHWRL